MFMLKEITFRDNAIRLEEVKAAMRRTKDKRLYETGLLHLLTSNG